MEYHSQLQYHAASFLIGNGLIKFNSRDGYYYNNSDLLPKLIPQKIPRVKKYKVFKKKIILMLEKAGLPNMFTLL